MFLFCKAYIIKIAPVHSVIPLYISVKIWHTSRFQRFERRLDLNFTILHYPHLILKENTKKILYLTYTGEITK